MTAYLEDESGAQLPVLESDVTLEIENGRGGILTLQRSAKGPRDRHLVSTWEGPVLTKPNEQFKQRDYYVRLPGAASEEAGLHTMLARFLGWTLPTVARFDGTECPLYLECIFPLAIVEQKRGWGGVQAQMPRHFGIRDVNKRAIEFTLGLEAHRIAVLRDQLRESLSQLRAEWKRVIGELDGLSDTLNGKLEGLQDEPSSLWPPPSKPRIALLIDDKWTSLTEAIKLTRRSLHDLEGVEVPLVSDVARDTRLQLSQAEESLSSLELSQRDKLEEFELERGELEALERRLQVVREDYRRNQDAVKLRTLGSLARVSIADLKCPTCAQAISDNLLSLAPDKPVMSLEENTAFLKSQIDTFQAMAEGLKKSIQGRSQERSALSEAADNLRTKIRAMRETLVADGRSFSVEAVRQRVYLNERLGRLSKSNEQFSRYMRLLETIAGQVKDSQSRLSNLPRGDLSSADESRLAQLEGDFVARLELYGVSSVPPKSVRLSREDYKPNYENFNIDFDLSASDMIRMIWAYLGSLLTVSSRNGASHPGFLLFDEPRQQATARFSFDELIKQSAQVRQAGHQVVLAISEEPEQIRKLLQGIEFTYIEFQGKILKRLSD
jgi:hypothetical protein